MAVYIVEEEKSKRVKIGYTSGDVWSRIDQLQTGNPEPLVLVKEYRDEGRDFEKRLHRKFQNYRLMGEWFDPKGDLWNYLADIKNKQNRQYLRDFMKPMSLKEAAILAGIIREDNVDGYR